MCRGLEESNRGSNFVARSSSTDDDTCSVVCELCSSAASVYCQADDAYLCRKCDTWVHGANFLARRHIRCFLCNTCHKLTKRYLIGASVEMVLPTLVTTSSTTTSSDQQRSQCDSSLSKTNCSTTLKTPFLFDGNVGI
ncbi:B-box domain protein 30 [Cannabis sativa]|uniref:B-box domain protein 30 n=1 Tax=Cannabis sativa TaxID=3483 RepID=UPI0029CA32AE|nr:B-box domain protein 30 [Cannabis sativa]